MGHIKEILIKTNQLNVTYYFCYRGPRLLQPPRNFASFFLTTKAEPENRTRSCPPDQIVGGWRPKSDGRRISPLANADNNKFNKLVQFCKNS